MSEISIIIAPVYNQIELLNQNVKSLNSKLSELDSIKKNISLGKSSGDITSAISNSTTDMTSEKKSLEAMSSQLDIILKEYQKTEEQLVKQKIENKDLNNVNQAGESSSSEDDEKNEALETLLEILEFILGFVPVINCVVDALSLIDDWKKATKDGKISLAEAIVLAFDIIALIGDVIQLGAIVKVLKKSTKAAKLAKTAAKESAEKAAKATKTAANKAAKTSGKYPTKAAKKAKTAKKAAEKATKKADAAAEAAKSAKKQVGKDVKDEVGKQAKNNVDDFTDNMEYEVMKEQYKDAVLPDE